MKWVDAWRVEEIEGYGGVGRSVAVGDGLPVTDVQIPAPNNNAQSIYIVILFNHTLLLLLLLLLFTC